MLVVRGQVFFFLVCSVDAVLSIGLGFFLETRVKGRGRGRVGRIATTGVFVGRICRDLPLTKAMLDCGAVLNGKLECRTCIGAWKMRLVFMVVAGSTGGAFTATKG